MSLTKYNGNVVSSMDYNWSDLLSNGIVKNCRNNKKLIVFGMKVYNTLIMNIDNFKLVFQASDVRKVDVYDAQTLKKLGNFCLINGEVDDVNLIKQ